MQPAPLPSARTGRKPLFNKSRMRKRLRSGGLSAVREAMGRGAMTGIPANARPGLWTAFWGNPTLLLSLTALMFAGHSIVGRLAVGEISPMTLTCARWALALIPLIFATRSHLGRDLAILRPRWVFVIALGALGFTAFNALFYTAAHRTTALNLSIIQGAIPALVLIGAWLVFGAKVRLLQAFGAFVTMVGVAAIASQGDVARLL